MGRDFLNKHLLWQIMDRESVSIWNDSWIPRMKGKKIRHPGLIDSQILEMVIEIIDKKVGMWKLNEIEH